MLPTSTEPRSPTTSLAKDRHSFSFTPESPTVACGTRKYLDFSQHYQVVRYDLRGYGESTIPPQPYAHHDDLAALLQHLGIEQAHILGISMGGRVAIDFTLTYPEMVTSLIRVNSGVGEFEPSEVLQNAWAEMEKAEETEGLDAVIELENRPVGRRSKPDSRISPTRSSSASSRNERGTIRENQRA